MAINYTNVKNIMGNRKSRGVSKYMLEEVYFSDSCKDSIEERDGETITRINPQNAWFDNGRYRFNFPALWYSANCSNKTIGLRRIEARAKSYYIEATFSIIRKSPTGPGASRKFSLATHILPEYSIEYIASNICRLINNKIDQLIKNKGLSTDPEDYCKLYFEYDIYNNNLSFNLLPLIEDTEKKFYLTVETTTDDFYSLFNIENNDLSNINQDESSSVVFPSVWNRRYLYIHASFVTGTSFNYLGRSGEFYTKPSKMYPFNGNSADFYFEVSYDGKNPVKTRNFDFVIDLCYIYDDREYQAE